MTNRKSHDTRAGVPIYPPPQHLTQPSVLVPGNNGLILQAVTFPAMTQKSHGKPNSNICLTSYNLYIYKESFICSIFPVSCGKQIVSPIVKGQGD